MENKKKILVVEDDLLSKIVYKTIFKNDYDVTLVEDGNTALETSKKYQFDLVIMDICLKEGGMNGVEAMIEMRKDGYHTKPIIAITAQAIPGDKFKFLNEGFTNYLSKPFNNNELKEMIKYYTG